MCICGMSGQTAGHCCNLLTTGVQAQAAAARCRVSAKAMPTGAIGALRKVESNASAVLQQAVQDMGYLSPGSAHQCQDPKPGS